LSRRLNCWHSVALACREGLRIRCFS
jgi:hypothetical protein